MNELFVYDLRRPWRLPIAAEPLEVKTGKQTWASFSFGKRLLGSSAFQTEAELHRAREGLLRQHVRNKYLHNKQYRVWAACKNALEASLKQRVIERPVAKAQQLSLKFK